MDEAARVRYHSFRPVARIAASLLLPVAALVFYRKAIRLWWTLDDAWLLHRAIVRPWTDAFQGDSVHQLFTPLLDVTYTLWVLLWGLHPALWYGAHLSLMTACAAAGYLALRLYVPVWPALAGALLFLAAPPLCTFATQLMLVHYLEAFLLGVLSIVAFVTAARRGSNPLVVLSALLYFAAMLAKEIAIPLPLVLLFLPERSIGARARHLVFHAVAAIAYFLWRYAAIGTVLGGTGWTIRPGEVPVLLATLPWKLLREWTGDSLGSGLVAVALLSIGVAAALRSRRAIALAAVSLALAVAPLIFISKEMQARYALTSWAVLVAGFSVGVARFRLAPQSVITLCAAAALIIANRQEWAATYATAQRMSEEGRAYAVLDGSGILRRPSIPPAAMTELQWLKEDHLGRARGTGWFYDDIYLCTAQLGGRRVFEWAPKQREVVEVTDRIPDLSRVYCSAIREDAQLEAAFSYRDEALFWEFGPYERGEWSVVMGGGLNAFPVPRRDGFHLAGVPGLTLRVRYEAPEGWVTYSPEIALDFIRQPTLEWRRQAAQPAK